MALPVPEKFRKHLSNEEFIEGLNALIYRLNSFNMPGSSKHKSLKFIVDGQQIGELLPNNLQLIQSKDPETFSKYLTVEGDDRVLLKPEYKSYDEKTKAMESILLSLKAKELFVELKGWRSEQYLVRSRFSKQPMFNIERAGVSVFGIKAYGCHINGYVKTMNDDGSSDLKSSLKLWIARRSKTKQTYPLMLDNFTGGGLTANLSVFECARKELQEEAGLSDDLLDKLVQVDAISYAYERADGVFREGEFIFDIELPASFQPKNTDGEVDCFYLMTVDEVKRAIIDLEFKTNSAVVTLNFLMRKGLVTADELPNYYEILENIHAEGL